VALNKNSFQVSTYTDEFGSHSANLANDGSRQTNFLVSVNSCAASLRATNPWWAVDLDDPTLVVRVDLTNRGDTAGTDHMILLLFISLMLSVNQSAFAGLVPPDSALRNNQERNKSFVICAMKQRFSNLF